jgi:hypothetical protein
MSNVRRVGLANGTANACNPDQDVEQFIQVTDSIHFLSYLQGGMICMPLPEPMTRIGIAFTLPANRSPPPQRGRVEWG